MQRKCKRLLGFGWLEIRWKLGVRCHVISKVPFSALAQQNFEQVLGHSENAIAEENGLIVRELPSFRRRGQTPLQFVSFGASFE